MQHTSLKELEQECQDMQDILQEYMAGQTSTIEQLNLIVERGCMIEVYQARTGKMLVDAKYWLNKAKAEKAEVVMQLLKDGIMMSAKTQNAIIECMCKDEIAIFDWIDRLNSSFSKQLDWCRTLVSKGKEELKFNGFGNPIN